MTLSTPTFLLLVFFVSIVAAPAPAQQTEFVTVRGQEIVGPDGSPLHLRGVNLGNWLVPEGYMFKFDSASSPRLINGVITELVGPERAREFWRRYREQYITRDDIHFIRESGLNSVRVPFNWRLFAFEEQEDAWTDEGFRFLDSVIRWCREEGVWAILDMHCAPGGQTGDNIDDSWGYPFLFDSPSEQARTAKLWHKIAARYRDERIVAGFDLLNEPIPHFVDRERLNPKLEPLYRKIVASIREVDTHHLILLGGSQWDTNFGVFGPPFDPKLVYTFHRYWCDTTEAEIHEYVEFREKYKVPIWMGESGENSDAWIASFRRLLERNGIGWCFWPYKKMRSPRCLVTFERPAQWDMITRYANSPRGGYASIRQLRPSPDTVWQSMMEFIQSSGFARCRPNTGYLRALGLQEIDPGPARE